MPEELVLYWGQDSAIRSELKAGKVVHSTKKNPGFKE
jgi:hypothetical protein